MDIPPLTTLSTGNMQADISLDAPGLADDSPNAEGLMEQNNGLNKQIQSPALHRSVESSTPEKPLYPRVYTRRRSPKVYCTLCDTHKDGFKGEPELMRHMDSEHVKIIKKWICVEPTDDGNHPQPVLPLSDCRPCTQQGRKYGAYYNAAAHLRRAHFRPKTRRSLNRKGKGVEKGKGQADMMSKHALGDWPPMSELRHWMKEVEEKVQEEPAQPEGEDKDEDGLFDFGDLPALESPTNELGTLNWSYPYTDMLHNMDHPVLDESKHGFF